MNQQKAKFLIIIVLFMLSFGFCTQSLAQKYSDLQTKTTQAALNRKKAIYPSKYGIDSEAAQAPEKVEKKKKKSFGSVVMDIVRSLILAIALFLGIAAYIVKHKDKFQNIKLPNALKNVPKEEKEPQVKQKAQQRELDPRDRKIKELVFKFFEINK